MEIDIFHKFLVVNLISRLCDCCVTVLHCTITLLTGSILHETGMTYALKLVMLLLLLLVVSGTVSFDVKFSDPLYMGIICCCTIHDVCFHPPVFVIGE